MFCFSKYTKNVEKLQETMKQIGRDDEVVVLEDYGFLPKRISSPYEYFVFKQNKEKHYEKEFFYEFLKLPEFWDVRFEGETARVYEAGDERATICFAEPIEKRIVQRVEWHLENGWVYKIDYYNKYGLKYVSEFLGEDKNVESKIYYSDINQEVVISQVQNDVIMLLENGMVRAFFNSYNEFVEFYMKEASISKRKILFVQEEENRFLNLKVGEEKFWDFVLFSNRELLEKYTNAGGKNGYRFYAIPERYPENYANGNAFVLTASDQIEKLEELIQELPEVVFHIAAHTQVSEKLHRLEEQENVKVYPGVGEEDLRGLWTRCDFYLDINHYREIDDAVNEAHQRNLLIMGFENTLHQRDVLIKECIFLPEDYKKMALVMKKIINNPMLMQDFLRIQQKKREEEWKRLL